MAKTQKTWEKIKKTLEIIKKDMIKILIYVQIISSTYFDRLKESKGLRNRVKKVRY